MDDRLVPDPGLIEMGDQGPATDGQRGRIEQVADLAQHGEQTTRPEQVLHEVLAGRLEVDEQRHLAARPVEVVEREVDAETAGDGQQVDDRVGRAADGREGHDRVEE